MKTILTSLLLFSKVACAVTIILAEDGVYAPQSTESNLIVDTAGTTLANWTQPATGAATVSITMGSTPEYLSIYNEDSSSFSGSVSLILVNNAIETVLATWSSQTPYTLPVFGSNWGADINDSPSLTGPSGPFTWSGNIAGDFDLIIRNTSNFNGSSFANSQVLTNLGATYTPVPEPSSLLALLISCATFSLRRKRK